MATLLATLWFCLITIQSIYGKKHLMGSNEKERTTKCAEEVCDYLCLATKCGNEHIVIDEEKHEADWMGIINVHCTEPFSCMGRITIDGKYSKSWFSGPRNIEMTKLYCNNAAKQSCRGAQYIFIDTKNQYLIGDVRESDILFKNAETANIVVADDANHGVTEQFFLNDVFTHNVMQMNIIALAPYSMVGSIFDLTGVYKKIDIQCKGEGSCSGSLFIFNRCVVRPYYATKILCGINACNGISIWILDEDDKCKKIHSDSRATHFRELVQLIPFVADRELNDEERETFAKRWTQQKQKDVFIMVENADSTDEKVAPPLIRAKGKNAVEIKQWSVLKKNHADDKYHVKEDTLFWKRLCGRNTKQSCKYHGDAFKVHRSSTKSQWLKGITDHLQQLSSYIDTNGKEDRHDEWIRNPSTVEYYGGVMIEGMLNKMAVGVALGFTAALGTVLAGHSVLIAAAHILHPLVLPGIVLVGASFYVNSVIKQNKARLQFPESKVNFEIDEEPINEEQSAAHDVFYNEFMEKEMSDANWIEVDDNGNLIEYDLLTGKKYYSENVRQILSTLNTYDHHDDGVYNTDYSQYTNNAVQIFIGAAVMICCCSFCFGGLFGIVFGYRHNKNERIQRKGGWS